SFPEKCYKLIDAKLKLHAGKETDMLNTILFDLDGTLLPFIEEEFVNCYFAKLVKKAAPLGYEKDALVHALWTGTKDMTQNNGERTNKAVFWERFHALLGENMPELEAAIDDFYINEFDTVREVLREDRDCGSMIRNLRDKGYMVVLASNPLFPATAIRTRLRWIGLELEDFHYITTYENSCYTKISPQYYTELLSAINKTPEQCVMFGNNALEDGGAAKLGIRTILIRDYLKKEAETDLDDIEQMSFAEAENWLDALSQL
ncbi:MAG: HAD family hydrolase, partial [Oscillospiraceae bacterium]